MTVIAVVALGGVFSGCNNDVDLSGGMTLDEYNIIQNYENAFITRFGQPDSSQTWGFGDDVASTRSGNTGGDYTPYPATHTYTDGSGNVVAGANMNHNEWGDKDAEFGGWIVPDPLTEGQKLRVQKYFQAHPDLDYKDPHYANFFVQQVYTGGTSVPTTGNHESTVAAGGQGHAGMTLNQLTVGQACSHINNFNAGTCSPSNVLNHEGKTQSDRITLMVNVDDTSCFGYHETNGSNVQTSTNHNDKMALVSAATIDAWAKQQNPIPGEDVVDKWNRSFMGFDYELLPECDIVMDSYALLSQVPAINDIHYAWDGQKVMTIGEAPETPAATPREEFDLTPYFTENVSVNDAECNNVNGKVVCTFKNRYYTSIVFTQRQGADWTKYDKVVFEFEGTSPVPATLSFGENNSVQITVGATGVEIANPYKRVLGGWETMTLATGDIGEGFDSNNPPTLTIKKVTLVQEGTTPEVDNTIVYYNPTYLLGDADNQKISFYSENKNMYGGIVFNFDNSDAAHTMTTTEGYLDLTKFQTLVANGYHPTSSDLKTWVKWQAACDHYYSDWIVTLTEAKRIGDTDDDDDDDNNDPSIVCRVIAEDLTVGEGSDFDFNDVVFDVCKNGTLIIRAIGGELPLYIGMGSWESATEVHQACIGTLPGDTQKGKNSHTYMRNTGWSYTGEKTSVPIDWDADLGHIDLHRTFNSRSDAKTIKIWVKKSSGTIELFADKGKVASKVCVGTDYKWCSERQDIDRKFRDKNGTKLFQQYVIGKLGDDWDAKTAWYQYKDKVAVLLE